MVDIVQIFMGLINVQAALVGMAAIQFWKWLTPGPVEGERTLETRPGTLMDRLVPFVGPLAAFVANIALEWWMVHPEIGKAGIVPQDVVRGVLSGIASDFIWRIYYKTVKGI